MKTKLVSSRNQELLLHVLSTVKADGDLWLSAIYPMRIEWTNDSIRSHLKRLYEGGFLGVWASTTGNEVLWIRCLAARHPAYIPVGIMLGAGHLEEIPSTRYRAIMTELNLNLLVSEGYA